MKLQVNQNENIMNNSNQVDKNVRIVKHSNDLKRVLPTLETADSIDKNINISCLSQKQEQGINCSVTPKRELKNSTDIAYQKNDALSNYRESHTSAINSTDRTTAPSSELNSHSRYGVPSSVNSLSPNENGYQTPSNRLSKKRSASGIYNENQNNQDLFNGGLEINNKSQVKNYPVSGTNINLSSSTAINANSVSGNPQINAPVLLSAVLQVIASLQRLKNSGLQNVTVKNDQVNYNDILSANNVSNNNTTSQILGTKLPGVHPTVAALALAYSLSVAASNSAQNKDGSNINATSNLNPEEILQGLNQLIYERINNLNLSNIKLNNFNQNNALNNVANTVKNKSSLNLVDNHSNAGNGNTGSYNLNLPPMDFILADRTGENTSTEITSGFAKNLNNIDSLEYTSYIEDANDRENSIKSYYDSLHNRRIEYEPIQLETSNNCIWNDLSYNFSLESIDFDTAYSRKHAFIRNELLFKHKPILEIERDNGCTDSRNVGFSGSKKILNNQSGINDQALNNRLQSICDGFFATKSDKNPINSINSLLQIVGGLNDVSVNNNQSKNIKN